MQIVQQTTSENVATYYTATRLRPLARRRANTLRPGAVFMRTRNPCDLARFLLFGLYVNDMETL